MHKRVHHAGEIICTLCPYKTEKPYAMGRHLAEVHNVGRVALCNQCDYKAGGAFGEIMLRRHMARHTQERNFQCDQCEFRAIRQVVIVLLKHRRPIPVLPALTPPLLGP